MRTGFRRPCGAAAGRALRATPPQQSIASNIHNTRTTIPKTKRNRYSHTKTSNADNKPQASDAPAELLLAALFAQLIEAQATLAQREAECEALGREVPSVLRYYTRYATTLQRYLFYVRTLPNYQTTKVSHYHGARAAQGGGRGAGARGALSIILSMIRVRLPECHTATRYYRRTAAQWHIDLSHYNTISPLPPAPWQVAGYDLALLSRPLPAPSPGRSRNRSITLPNYTLPNDLTPTQSPGGRSLATRNPSARWRSSRRAVVK